MNEFNGYSNCRNLISFSKTSLIIVVLLTFVHTAISQRFYSVVFDKLPQDYQLYPRNASNLAKVKINGVVEAKDWNYISVQVLRNGKPFQYNKSSISYLNGVNGRFDLEMTIKAELSEYDFLVYAIKSADSVLIVNRKNVVAGDVFLVSGQSNSYNGWEFDRIYKGEFARSFGNITDYINYQPYNPVDTLWDLANNRAKVGLWASEFQRQVIEKHQIPVCIINGGSGGSSMQYNLVRSNDPSDFNTSSGRLYYRVKKAGLLENIKAFIYRQGENEANDNNGALIWKESMIKHMEALKREYPGLQQFYIPQINVLEGNQANQGLVRESQRQLTTNNPNIKGFATIGTQGYDGVHYSPDGYFQSATELYRIVAANQYGIADKINNYSPNVQKAYFSTSDKLNVVLEFDQPIIVQGDTSIANKSGKMIVKKMAENFGFSSVKYPGNYEWIIQNIKSIDNKVLIQLFEPPSENVISYIPTNYATSEFGPFAGPFIKNENGMRAFAFQNIAIDPAPIPKILANKIIFKAIPQDYQLIPRDLKTNLGKMKISGFESSGNFDRISVLSIRGQSKVFYTSNKLSYINGSAFFDISVPILAEKVNYGLRVYLINSKNDSTLVASKNSIVSGDIIVFNGNRHVSKVGTQTLSNSFIRTFGTVNTNLTQMAYLREDTLWSVANFSNSTNIGDLAFNIAAKIAEKNAIPIAIINAADNFSTTTKLAEINGQLISNLEKLEYRLTSSNSSNFIRGYYLQSGELDTKADLLDWEKNMSKHLSEVKKMMPNLEQVFIGQLNLEPDSILSAQIREFQRKIPNVLTFPTYGVSGFDGIKYSDQGLYNLSNLVSALFLSHLYNQPTTTKTSFPSLLKAVQSVANPAKITLVFDENITLQVAAMPKDELRLLFKIDQKYGLIESIDVLGNQLVLTLKTAEKRSNISFISGQYNLLNQILSRTQQPISNLQGQAILCFNQFPIQQSLTPLLLKLQSQAYNKLEINWNSTPSAKQYRIEKKVTSSGMFERLQPVQANQTYYVDQNIKLGSQISYRVIAQSDSTESDASNELTVSFPDSLPALLPKVQSVTTNAITLAWDVSQGAKGYLIEKKSSQGVFTQVAVNESPLYTDNGLTSNAFYEYKIAYFTTNGLSKYAYLKQRTELALANEPLDHKIQVFPNPTKNKIQIQWDTPFTGTVKLIHLDGNELFSKQLDLIQSFELDVAEYPFGVYILQINSRIHPEVFNMFKVILQD